VLKGKTQAGKTAEEDRARLTAVCHLSAAKDDDNGCSIHSR
jgi:hypothetical protein